MHGVDDAEREMLGNSSADDREKIYARRNAHWEVVKKFYEDFPPLVERYVRMDHKRPFWRLRAATERKALRPH